jgi:hypothetical protein
LILFVIYTEAYSQNQFYIGTTIGSKYSLSTSRRLNVHPTRTTGTFDVQGGLILGYGNQKFSFESSFLLGTLGIKHNYESPTVFSRRNFKVVYRADDLLTIQMRGHLSWWESHEAKIAIGSSLGVNMNIQYSKNLDRSVFDQEKSMQGFNGTYILKYSDLSRSREETNFSITSGFFVKWKISPRFNLRSELGFTMGIDQLYTRAMLAGVEYIDPTGQDSRGFVGNSTNFAHSKGDHFFFNLSTLYSLGQESGR